MRGTGGKERRDQGIGAGIVPTNLHTAAIDGVIQVDAADAKEWDGKPGKFDAWFSPEPGVGD